MEKLNLKKLTPTRNADIDIYKDALDFVFEDNDIINIALSGSYSAGKSSVIESYKQIHKEKKFLNISVANFEYIDYVNFIDNSDKGDCIENKSVNIAGLERKILNQLLHKIEYKNIKQTKFKIKQDINYKENIIYSFLLLLFMVANVHNFYFESWVNMVSLLNKNSLLYKFLNYSTNIDSLLLSKFVIIALTFLIILKVLTILKNNNIFKRININGNEIELLEQNHDSIFDKYLEEMLYLFENSKADVIVFEDIDRFNSNLIFQHLREINKLLNERRISKKNMPIRFFYLIRDDLFSSKDRTKFFDLIIPIIPVIDSSNSYDKFVELLGSVNVLERIDSSFLQGVSLYIDDMRILLNIYNEFIVYYKKIGTTEQDINKLIAIIIYKNVFPRDFADTQLNIGFVSTIFNRKEEIVNIINENSSNSNINDINLLYNKPIKELIKRENIDKIFSINYVNFLDKETDFYEIKSSDYFDLLKYLIRNGYIDETYEDYMGYFYPNTLTINDKKFLRSISDKKFKGYSYKLDRPDLIIKKLYEKDFDEIEILNFYILKYLLSTENHNAYLDKIISNLIEEDQLDDYIDGNTKIYRFFILEYLQLDFNVNNKYNYAKLVNLINSEYPQFLNNCISSEIISDVLVKQYILLTLYYCDEKSILDVNNELSVNFNEYIANDKYFLNIDQPNCEKIIDAFELLNIKLISIDYASANKVLFTKIYNNKLYQLNFKNIILILSNVYDEKNEEELLHKNFTLIVRYQETQLYNYVIENINEYIDLYVINCNEFISDDYDYVLQILNNTYIQHENKEKYIKHLITKIEKIKDVSDKSLWNSIIKENLLNYSELNILEFYFNSGNGLDNNLISFINCDNAEWKFTEDEINNEYGEGKAESFFESVIACSELIDEKYIDIITKLDSYYDDDFKYQGISANKIKFLIDNNTITMTKENVTNIRNNYRNNLIYYIENNILNYLEKVIDEESITYEELIELLSSGLEDNIKIKLLEKCERYKIKIVGKNYSEPVNKYILANNFEPSELINLIENFSKQDIETKEILTELSIKYIETVIQSNQCINNELFYRLIKDKLLSEDNKIDLFINQADSLTLVEYEKSFRLIGNTEYLKLFSNGYPILEENGRNLMLLTKLVKKNIITSYKIENGSFKISRKKNK